MRVAGWTLVGVDGENGSRSRAQPANRTADKTPVSRNNLAHPSGNLVRVGAHGSAPWSRCNASPCAPMVSLANHRSNCGVPGRIRTRDPLLRRQPLYPLSYWDSTPQRLIMSPSNEQEAHEYLTRIPADNVKFRGNGGGPFQSRCLNCDLFDYRISQMGPNPPILESCELQYEIPSP